MIEVRETDDDKWGLYLGGVLLGDSKHRYDADHAKQILLLYLQKHGGKTRLVRLTSAFAVGTSAVLVVVCAVLLVLWIRDVQNDRKHTVTINTITPVFVGNGGDGGCHGTRLTNVKQGANLPVRRIRYLKDCATVDVLLPDGRRGYVVLGIGDVSVNPPLPPS